MFAEMPRQVLKDGTALKAYYAVFLNGFPKMSAVVSKLLG